jgi:hypothetical protein
VTEKLSEPDPVRPVPFGNVRKLLVLVAVHAQPACVVTVNDPPPAAAGTVAGDGAPPAAGTGLGFDGFSASTPADPNAPLINPGILLRGTR